MGDRNLDVLSDLFAMCGDLTHLLINASMMIPLSTFIAHPSGNTLNNDE